MSYILDALKKSQAEQNPDSLGLNLTPPPTQPKRSPWLVIVALALCANLLFFGWYFLNIVDDIPQSATNAEQSIQNNIGSRANQQDLPPRQARNPTSSAVTRSQPATEPNTAPIANTGPVSPTRWPTATTSQPSPAPSPTPVKPAVASQQIRVGPTQRVPLTELTQAEQTLYAGFSYTSHIFTEDADLRAVVIDGQRLQAGDAFKGLNIVEITETGVIFAESRRGKTRHVVVNPFE